MAAQPEAGADAGTSPWAGRDPDPEPVPISVQCLVDPDEPDA